jgi:hypothetical protein
MNIVACVSPDSKRIHFFVSECAANSLVFQDDGEWINLPQWVRSASRRSLNLLAKRTIGVDLFNDKEVELIQFAVRLFDRFQYAPRIKNEFELRASAGRPGTGRRYRIGR